MKFLKIILSCFLLASAAPAEQTLLKPETSPAVELPKTKNCRLFILGGQSNMNGCGKANELPFAYQKHPDNVVIWDNRRKCWVKLAKDTTAIARNYQFGPELAFSHKLAAAFPKDTIAVVKTSAGGTSLHSSWAPNGSMYARFIQNMNNAATQLKQDDIPFTISGMLWMQGEADSKQLDTAKAYEGNLKQLFSNIRVQTKQSQLPIVIGRISSSLLKKTPWKFDHCPVVQAAQDRVAAADTHVHIVPTNDLSTLEDNTHFDSKAQITLGALMAELMIQELR